jgi:opacity protein-like surface antigen
MAQRERLLRQALNRALLSHCHSPTRNINNPSVTLEVGRIAKMRVLHAAAVASLVMTPLMAAAEPINGMYINFGGGYNSHGDRKSLAGDTPSLGIRLSGEPKNLFKEGGIGIAAIGWGFGDGFRLELEGSYRQNAVWKNVTAGSWLIASVYIE